jgi:hypothetical protein
MMVVLEVDPNLVRPGWTPLVVVVLLGIVLFFLARSMIKQFGKIDVPADHDPATSAAGAAPEAQRNVAERSVTQRAGNPPIPDLRARPSDGSGDAAGGSEPPDRH